MPANKPRISVLILTFNQAQFVERALQSVVEQQSSNYDLEIIVTDDGSSDGTVDVIDRFVRTSPVSIKVLAQKHEGVTAIAKNFLSMINLANGDFIAFLAGDDSFSQDRFSQQLEKFSANPNLKICYSDGVNCTAGEIGQRCHSAEIVGLMRSGDTAKIYRHLTSQAPVLFIQGVLAKAEFLKEIQPFDVELIADDWVFNIKIFGALVASGGDYDFETSPCFIRNIHGDNTSRNLIVHYERVRQVADRYCNNKRSIKARFVGQSLLSTVKRKRKDEFIFFAGKLFLFPESLYWFAWALASSVQRKLARS
jgi:glycosyltransferase involved in cell wall biosynthesis